MILFTILASMIAGWKNYNVSKWVIGYTIVGSIYITVLNVYLASIKMAPLMSAFDLVLNVIAMAGIACVFFYFGRFLRKKIKSRPSRYETYYETDDDQHHSGK